MPHIHFVGTRALLIDLDGLEQVMAWHAALSAKPLNTLFYPETYPILLVLFYVGYKYKTKENKIGN